VTPSAMPQHKPARVVQGRYTALVRKWSDGTWKNETGRANGKQGP
jgi:hypothetical protein